MGQDYELGTDKASGVTDLGGSEEGREGVMGEGPWGSVGGGAQRSAGLGGLWMVSDLGEVLGDKVSLQMGCPFCL